MKPKKTFWIVIWVLFILGFMFIPTAKAEAPFNEVILTPDEVLTDRLTQWVHDLAVCESQHNDRALNASDGGSRSVGYLQFKDGTFMDYSRRYKFGFTPDDIWDGDKQAQLAVQMLKENIKNQNHWYNCSKKIGRIPVEWYNG